MWKRRRIKCTYEPSEFHSQIVIYGLLLLLLRLGTATLEFINILYRLLFLEQPQQQQPSLLGWLLTHRLRCPDDKLGRCRLQCILFPAARRNDKRRNDGLTISLGFIFYSFILRCDRSYRFVPGTTITMCRIHHMVWTQRRRRISSSSCGVVLTRIEERWSIIINGCNHHLLSLWHVVAGFVLSSSSSSLLEPYRSQVRLPHLVYLRVKGSISII